VKDIIVTEDHSIESTLLHWLRNAKRSAEANYAAAEYFSSLHLWFGVPTAAMSALVGTSIFASLTGTTGTTAKIAIASVSMLAAILAALQTILNFEKRATRHRTAGARYNSTKRQIEELLVNIKEFQGKPEALLTPLRRELNSLAVDSPQPPRRIWKRISQ
jgi:conflict system pore-forming effector with SLATT domain